MKSNSRLPTPPAPWLGRKGSLLLWREMRRNRSRFMRLVPDAQILREDCPPRVLSRPSLKRRWPSTVKAHLLRADTEKRKVDLKLCILSGQPR